MPISDKSANLRKDHICTIPVEIMVQYLKKSLPGWSEDVQEVVYTYDERKWRQDEAKTFVVNCHRIIFKSPTGSVVKTYMQYDNIAPATSLDISDQMGAVVALDKAGFIVKLTGQVITQIDSFAPPIGAKGPPQNRTYFHMRGNQLRGTRGDVKIEFSPGCYPDYKILVRSKVGRRFAAAISRTSGGIKAALRAAESISSKIDNAELPEPLADTVPELKTLKSGLLQRESCVRAVSVEGVAVLNNDGSFSFDAANPSQSNVWIMLLVFLSRDKAEYGSKKEVRIAFNGHQWYQLYGEKNVRIATDARSDINFTDSDIEFMKEAVSRATRL